MVEKQSINFALDYMIKGLETLGDIQTPLNVMLENLVEAIADKVMAIIKEEDSSKPKYLHVRNCVRYCMLRILLL